MNIASAEGSSKTLIYEMQQWNLEYQCVALAEIIQAALIIDEIATTGEYPKKYLNSSRRSIFKSNSLIPIETFGEISEMKLGLSKLISILTKDVSQAKSSLVRYVFALIQLQRLSQKQSKIVAEIYLR